MSLQADLNSLKDRLIAVATPDHELAAAKARRLRVLAARTELEKRAGMKSIASARIIAQRLMAAMGR